MEIKRAIIFCEFEKIYFPIFIGASRINILVISDVFGLIITVYGTTVSDTKYKSAGQLNNGYYVDEQALESLMKKILQQQENLRRDAKVAKLESILDIEVRYYEG